jgi:hypothetical protein
MCSAPFATFSLAALKISPLGPAKVGRRRRRYIRVGVLDRFKYKLSGGFAAESTEILQKIRLFCVLPQH